MGSVTSFTADRMKAIEDTTVVSGLVDINGHLLLYTRDNTEIDAGNVKGPPTALPDRLSVGGKEVSDWNNAIEAGFYWGTSAANAPLAIDAGAGAWFMGTVKVYNSPTNFRIVQELREARYAGVDVVYTRYSDGAGVWQPWSSDISNLSGSLGTLDLDTVIVPGVYYQGTVVNGTVAKHYPAPMTTAGLISTTSGTAGMLEVFKWRDSDQVIQRFTRRPDATQPQVWVRGKYLLAGTWSAWQDISSPVSDWVDLSSYLAAGISSIPDSSVPAPQARRVGNMVELMFSSLYIDSISVPTNGDVTNRSLTTAIPAQFRPSIIAGITPGPAGLLWGGNIAGNGVIALGAITPVVTATATATYTNQRISGYAFYPAAN